MRKTFTFALTLVLIFAALIDAAAGGGADARAEETLKQARAAIGGDDQVRSVQSMTALGKFRRSFGERETSGEREVSFQLPDKYVSTDTTAVSGLNTAVSSSRVLDGERATMAGRGQMMILAGGAAASEEQKQAMYRRSFRSEWARLLVGLLLTSPQSFPVEFKYAGEAEAEDGKADVLDATGPDNFAARLFLDKTTHLPLMLTYKTQMRRMVGGGPVQLRHGGGSQAELDKLAKEMADKAGPPQEVEQQIRFSEYRKVGGLLLPHRISQGEDGQVREEWEVMKYVINPQLKADTFKRD
ncbi:MAG: hypothetical protein LC800_18120 [Acidobacteria bacterium]|nr:hypothetical protein [Acidobacteriota bacterium]